MLLLGRRMDSCKSWLGKLKYNKEMANEFGTGWAAENAEGYYPTSKLYYNENPVWGGNSWDNQTLFDDKGYPLDSLRFYRDAISSNTKYSRVVVALCDKNNNVLEYRVVKVVPGKSITYTLPDIKGYTKEKIRLKFQERTVNCLRYQQFIIKI